MSSWPGNVHLVQKEEDGELGADIPSGPGIPASVGGYARDLPLLRAAPQFLRWKAYRVSITSGLRECGHGVPEMRGHPDPQPAHGEMRYRCRGQRMSGGLPSRTVWAGGRNSGLCKTIASRLVTRTQSPRDHHLRDALPAAELRRGLDAAWRGSTRTSPHFSNPPWRFVEWSR